jgi:steroid delta-isomerase-like uncharacterized protein
LHKTAPPLFGQSSRQPTNDRDYSKASSLASPTIELIDEATGQTFHGLEGLRQFVQYWLGAFPDYRQEITNLVADDHSVAIEFIFRGTNTGPLPMPDGEIPPTGRSLNNRSAAFFRMENGKVASYHLYADVLSIMQQLGLAPQAEQAGA